MNWAQSNIIRRVSMAPFKQEEERCVCCKHFCGCDCRIVSDGLWISFLLRAFLGLRFATLCSGELWASFFESVFRLFFLVTFSLSCTLLLPSAIMIYIFRMHSLAYLQNKINLHDLFCVVGIIQNRHRNKPWTEWSLGPESLALSDQLENIDWYNYRDTNQTNLFTICHDRQWTMVDWKPSLELFETFLHQFDLRFTAEKSKLVLHNGGSPGSRDL